MPAERFRMLQVLLRGAHAREALRREVAGILRCPLEDIGWATGTGSEKFMLDHSGAEEGFRTQATLTLDLDSAPAVQTDLDLARALAARLKEDALVLADPTVPGEPFHGLLARPDGRVFRAPLREFDSGGIGIDEDASAWREWILRG